MVIKEAAALAAHTNADAVTFTAEQAATVFASLGLTFAGVDNDLLADAGPELYGPQEWDASTATITPASYEAPADDATSETTNESLEARAEAIKADVVADLGILNPDAVSVAFDALGNPVISIVDGSGQTIAQIERVDSLDRPTSRWVTNNVDGSPEYIVSTLAGDSSPYGTARKLVDLGVIEQGDIIYYTDHLNDDVRGACYMNNQLLVIDYSGTWTADCPPTQPEPEPEPIPEPEPVAVVEPTPEPVVVSEPTPEPVITPEPDPVVTPEPEPAPEPVTDRVRLYQTFAYGCVDGECGLLSTVFLTFDSVADAQEFFASPEGQQTLRDILAGGNNLGNCVYITDGVERVQQISLVTEDTRYSGRTVKELALNDNGVPVLDMVRGPHDATFSTTDSDRSIKMDEVDFERRLVRGIGDTPDADDRRLPSVSGWNTNTIGVGAMQELELRPGADRWDFVGMDEAVTQSESAIVAAAGLTEAQYAVLETMPLPAEFYDPDTSIGERARALRDAAEARGIEMSRRGSENLARVITEQALGQDGNMRTFNEAIISRDNPQLALQPEYEGRPATLKEAVYVSSINRELILRAPTFSNQ